MIYCKLDIGIKENALLIEKFTYKNTTSIGSSSSIHFLVYLKIYILKYMAGSSHDTPRDPARQDGMENLGLSLHYH